MDQLVTDLEDEHSNCKTKTKFVLSGFSQGALVVHLALNKIANSDPELLDAISAVVLIADPAKIPHPDETLWEGDYTVAGSGVTKAEGIWTRCFGDDPLTSSATGRTLSDCPLRPARLGNVAFSAEPCSYVLW